MLETLRLIIETQPLLTDIVIFIFGLFIGSFLNVCIYRLPFEGKSILRPKSHCLSCEKPIAWYDNIPLLSYLLLRGRCRNCGAKISFQYFFVELLTGIIFLLSFLIFGLEVKFFFFVYLACSLIITSFIDFKHKIIPDEITFLGILIGLVASFFFPALQGETNSRLGIANSVLGVLVGGGLLYGTAIMGNFLFRRESMGGGDIKLLAMIGAFLGPKLVILTFFVAPLIAAPIGIFLKLTRKSEIISFGPYLGIASLVAFFWGYPILNFIFKI